MAEEKKEAEADFIAFDFSDAENNNEETENPFQVSESLNFSPSLITRQTFNALLACYPTTVEGVTRLKATDKVILDALLKEKKLKKTERKEAVAAEKAKRKLTKTESAYVQGFVDARLDLDHWRYVALPESVRERFKKEGKKERYFTKEEVVKLMEWKLQHGINRPTLLGMVKSNPSNTIRKATSDAFDVLPKPTPKAESADDTSSTEDAFPKTSLDTLAKPLRGVGTATASLVLAIATQGSEDLDHEIPFYSDDVYLWLCMKEYPRGIDEDRKSGRKKKFKRPDGELNVQYNLREYRELWDEVRRLQTRLNKSESLISCVDIEKVAYVLRHIDLSGYFDGREEELKDYVPVDEGISISQAKAEKPNYNRGYKKRKRGEEDDDKGKKYGGRNAKKKKA